MPTDVSMSVEVRRSKKKETRWLLYGQYNQAAMGTFQALTSRSGACIAAEAIPLVETGEG